MSPPKEPNSNDDKYEPLVLPRHTYSENNAKRFIEVINKSLENKTNEFISCESAMLAVTSLKQRLNEAFLWLINNDLPLALNNKYTKENYNVFRSKVKLTPVVYGGKPGVLIEYKKYKNIPIKQRKQEGNKTINSTSISRPSNLISENTEEELEESSGHKIKLHWRERVLNYLTDDNERMLILDTPEDFNYTPLDEISIEWLHKTFSSTGYEYEVDVMMIKSIK